MKRVNKYRKLDRNTNNNKDINKIDIELLIFNGHKCRSIKNKNRKV